VNPLVFDLAFGLLLGFSLTIPPGPMNAFIASQSVRSFREGVVAGCGAMSADLVLGVLVYALHSTVDLSAELRWIYLLGAVVMVYLGMGLLKRVSGPSSRPETSGVRTYSSALGLGVTNPFQIIWWLTAGLAFAYLGGWVLFVGLFGAIAVWVVAFPWAVHLGTERRPGVARAVVIVSGAVIFAFAAYFVVLAL
jgi:threonine/homoserine/homoserine lactone efflux protein